MSTPMQGLADRIIDIARKVEMLKQPCSDDPESPRAIQNSRCMSISHALRELARDAAAPIEATPFGWAVLVQDGGYVLVRDEGVAKSFAAIGLLLTPLYDLAAPVAQRQPLSDEDIANLWIYRNSTHGGDLMLQLQDFARAIEAAHDIGEKK